MPYAPETTFAGGASYDFTFKNALSDGLTMSCANNGVGRIWWNESNTHSQKFYSLLGASVSARRKGVELSLWWRNLTGARYDTFYFVSVGNSFLQRGNPRQYGVSLSVDF